MAAPAPNAMRGAGVMVDRFAENAGPYTPLINKIPRAPGGATEEVYFYLLTPNASNENAGSLFQTMMGLIGEDETMGDQMCSYVLSAINVWFPMMPAVEEFMKGLNWTMVTRKFPEELPGLIEAAPALSWRDTLITLAQLILMLFKNISEVNYATYMIKRIQAIKTFISAKDSKENVIALPVEKAMVIKRILGVDVTLRKEILEYLLTVKHQSSALGRVCTYLSGILAWTEMTYLQFIFEELVLTSSPILKLNDMAMEVMNYCRALISILEVTHPQYYKILTKVSDQKLVERNRFPILIEVARRLKEGKSMSAQNFKGSANVLPQTVDLLIAIHKGQPRPPSKVSSKPYDFLTGQIGISGGVQGLMINMMEEA